MTRDYSPISTGPLDGLSILVAEDDLADIIAGALSNRGAHCRAVRDGEAAVEAAMAAHFDLIVFNYRMPRLNGAEALRVLRDRGHTTPVIFVSAWSRHEIPEKIDDLGAEDWIEKPFPMRLLTERIREIVEHHREGIGE